MSEQPVIQEAVALELFKLLREKDEKEFKRELARFKRCLNGIRELPAL